MSDAESDPNRETKAFDKLRDAWLSAVTSAEAELAKATARLREKLGLSADPSAGRESTDVMSRLRRHREEFERKLDEGIHAALTRVRAPIDKEVASLRARVEKLQGRLDVRRRRQGKANDREKHDRKPTK